MKNIRIFYLEIFSFLVVKFSIYLNRHVFVMTLNSDAALNYKHMFVPHRYLLHHL